MQYNTGFDAVWSGRNVPALQKTFRLQFENQRPSASGWRGEERREKCLEAKERSWPRPPAVGLPSHLRSFCSLLTKTAGSPKRRNLSTRWHWVTSLSYALLFTIVIGRVCRRESLRCYSSPSVRRQTENVNCGMEMSCKQHEVLKTFPP